MAEPFNTLIQIIKEYENVSFVTGANLAMCLGVITDDSVTTLEEAVVLAKEYGAKSMVSKDDLIPKNA